MEKDGNSKKPKRESRSWEVIKSIRANQSGQINHKFSGNPSNRTCGTRSPSGSSRGPSLQAALRGWLALAGTPRLSPVAGWRELLSRTGSEIRNIAQSGGNCLQQRENRPKEQSSSRLLGQRGRLVGYYLALDWPCGPFFECCSIMLRRPQSGPIPNCPYPNSELIPSSLSSAARNWRKNPYPSSESIPSSLPSAARNWRKNPYPSSELIPSGLPSAARNWRKIPIPTPN